LTLDSNNARRRSLASGYDRGLTSGRVVIPKRRLNSEHVYHQYVIRDPHRDGLRAFLKGQGIEALIHYPVPVHLQPGYCDRPAGGNTLRETEVAAREVLSLPIYPELSDADGDHVIHRIRSYDPDRG